jgi:23S rRNA (adenine-N6)-dimethyltransferase
VPGRPLGRPRQSRNPPGAHFLTDRRLIDQLVRASGAGAGDLVLDLGAGYGALTGPLASAGARVIAIELDPGLAGRLRRRFCAEPLVGVVEADLREVPLPRRPFYVVASPPFALTTLLCRRLLGDRSVRLSGAELIVEWGAAKWLSSREPRDREMARWAARYQMRLVRRVPAASFSPPPRADAAYLRIRPRRRAP